MRVVCKSSLYSIRLPVSRGKFVAFNNKIHNVNKVVATIRGSPCFARTSELNTGKRPLCMFRALDVHSERACKYNTNIAQTRDRHDDTSEALAKWGYPFCAQLRCDDCIPSVR